MPSEPNVSTVEHPISARRAGEVVSVSTDGSGVDARSAEEAASVRTGGQTATNARSAFRKSMLDVLYMCLTMRILICKAEWLSSVRKNIT